jgi:Protein of unknown function (DUF3106)
MSRNRTTRNSRPDRLLRALAKQSVVSLLLVALSAGAAMAQHPLHRYRQQHPAAQRVQNNRPAANPNARPQVQPARPQAQPTQPQTQPAHQPAPIERVQPEGQPRPFSQSESRPAGNVTPVRPTPPTANSQNGQLVVPNRPGQTQQHLASWIEAHRNMPLADQQRALENEPNFRSLPAQEQQQLHQRLTQLHSMPPQQQQRVIERTEAMERLPPRQRQQVRDAMSQIGSLPEDRQHAVAHAFHQALTIPEAQRQAWLNSPQVRGQFNDNERDTINHLLSVQPAAAQAGFGWAKPPVPQQAPHE